MALSIDFPLLPKTKYFLKQKEDFIQFLQSETIGIHELQWMCPISNQYSGIRVERMPRNHEKTDVKGFAYPAQPVRDYYREPYPIYLEILMDFISAAPRIRISMNQEDLLVLIHALQ